MKKYRLLLTILLTLPLVSFAKLTCPAYHPNTENRLSGISLFDKVDRMDYELAPTQDKTTGDRVEQIWDSFDKDPKTQTYFRCKYLKTEKTITEEIAKDIKKCQFNFPLPGKETALSIAEFHCE